MQLFCLLCINTKFKIKEFKFKFEIMLLINSKYDRTYSMRIYFSNHKEINLNMSKLLNFIEIFNVVFRFHTLIFTCYYTQV